MCAIAGVLSHREEKNRLVALRDCMVHRGPDSGTAFYASYDEGSTHVAFGHRRLAIRDLSPNAKQPMTDSSGRFTLIYNGEIYNHTELRNRLEASGAGPFHSTGDTEVLLKAWVLWGDKTPELLQGEFAFAIWDQSERTLTLCRDRLGIKPLYYCHNKDGFAFASEVSALAKAGFLGTKISAKAIDSYLAFGSVAEPHTVYEGGHVVEAGSLLKVSSQDFKIVSRRFWQNPFGYLSVNDSIDLDFVAGLLSDAVTCRLVSDVPLALFLSGGIDSGSIAAAATRGTSSELFTLSAFSEEGESADRREARRVAAWLKTRHTEVPLPGSIFATLAERAIHKMDQPSMDGINTFAISEAAHRTGFKVALSGVGADELFCGYGHFHRAKHFAWLRRVPKLPWGRFSGRPSEKLAAFYSSSKEIWDYYGISRALFLDSSRSKLIAGQDTTPLSKWVRELVPWIENVRDPINALSAMDIEIYLKNVLLRDTDSMGMANSLEIRGPFLDHRLVELVASISGRSKVAGTRNKPLILQTIGKDLPKESIERKKSGFSFHWNELIDGALQNQVRATFSSDYGGVWYQLGIDLQVAEKVYSDYSKRKNGVIWSQVWALYSLANWLLAHRSTASETKPIKSAV